MCLLLTDFLFLNVKVVPFIGKHPREQTHLAITVISYFAFVPLVVWTPLVLEPWIEKSVQNMVFAVGVIAATHLLLRTRHDQILREHCSLAGLEDDEEEFPHETRPPLLRRSRCIGERGATLEIQRPSV